MRTVFFLLALFSIMVSCGRAPLVPAKLAPSLQPGDLIFQDLDCGDLCTAIEKVTVRKGLPPISHVAVVEKIGPGGVVLIEALGSVRRIGFDAFVKRSRSGSGRAKILVGRLKEAFRPGIPFFLNELRARLGKPYDRDFLPDNGAYYCSELVSDAMAALGTDLFPRHPMHFGKPGTWARRVWEQEFTRRNRSLPEGIPGTNPADMAASPYIKIVYSFQ